MSYSYPTSPQAVPGYPVYATFASFPIACFTLTLFTDIAYWLSANLLWQNFSAWLLFSGLVFGGLALVAGILEYLLRRDIYRRRPSWPAAIGKVIVMLLAFLNSFIHAGDGWTAVVPYGLAVSAVTVLVMIVTAFLGRATVASYAGGRAP